MIESALLVDKVTKSYGQHLVLDAVSFDIAPGEVCGLIGLNGIGKTTLIKIMIDLLKADSGSISFAGGSKSTDVAGRYNLSYLPEKFNPSRYLKGWEFLSIALSFFNIKCRDEEALRYCKALDFAEDALYRRVGSYSKGMAQKLGLMAAFMSNRPLLALDEPMSGLDPRARILVKEQIKEYNKAGSTVFFSSHILADVDEICDKIVVLHDRKILFIGTPDELQLKFNENSLEKAFLALISN